MSFEKSKNNFFQSQTPVNKSLALYSSPYIPENGGLGLNNISEGPLKTLEYPPGLKFNKLGILNKEQGIESEKFLDFLLDDLNTDNSKPKFSQHQKSLKENILKIFNKTFSNAAELTSSFDNVFIDTNSSSLLLGNLGGNNLEKTRFSSTMNLALEDAAIYKDNSKINKAFKSSKYTPEHIINAISEHRISCVPLLNEVGSKMKKEVDCILKETIVNKNKQFLCTYTLGGEIIGFSKGLSKQDAKVKAAEEAIKTLLTNGDFHYEKAFITLSVQKKTENQGTKQGNSPKENSPTNLLFSEKSQNENESQKESALYDLNLICKLHFITPNWSLKTIPGAEIEYEASVSLNNLSSTGRGKRKLDAKRDAATKLIQQIKNDKDLTQRYLVVPTRASMKKTKVENSDPSERARNLFKNAIKPKLLLNLDKENQEWKQNLTNFNKDLEDYLITIDKKYSVDDAIMNIMESFFAEVAKYTKMITSSAQQTSIQSSGSLCNYISNCSLTLIGSFALDCMRNNNLCIDTALVFHEEKSVSEMELLQMYKNELEKYHEEYSTETSSSFFEMQFSIEKSEKGNYVSVVIRTSFGNIQINIQVSDPKTKSCKLPIHHIKRIYDSFEQEERLNHFRSLMRLMRLWKTNNDLQFFPVELLDVALMNEVMTNNSTNLSHSIINSLTVLSSEELLKVILERFGPQYVELNKTIPIKLKYRIMTICSKSLEAIAKGNFSESTFC